MHAPCISYYSVEGKLLIKHLMCLCKDSVYKNQLCLDVAVLLL